MHSKNTVKYICECYPSGNKYYYKQELITHDSWNNPKSINWSSPRPISERTYKNRKTEGFKTEVHYSTKLPAIVIPLKNVNKS
ncbi:hypothetical protein [Bacillus solitudinis]|uniref:hypothetical protein n=1 Tax=Bacillus solitudinis TaxID=2014074 RepID=UPI000C246125|nr:hypothetical protein [Bacillus solitudinis]